MNVLLHEECNAFSCIVASNVESLLAIILRMLQENCYLIFFILYFPKFKECNCKVKSFEHIFLTTFLSRDQLVSRVIDLK